MQVGTGDDQRLPDMICAHDDESAASDWGSEAVQSQNGVRKEKQKRPGADHQSGSFEPVGSHQRNKRREQHYGNDKAIDGDGYLQAGVARRLKPGEYYPDQPQSDQADGDRQQEACEIYWRNGWIETNHITNVG